MKRLLFVFFLFLSACAPAVSPTGTALPPTPAEVPAAPTEAPAIPPTEEVPTPEVTPAPVQVPEELCDKDVLQAALDAKATAQVGYQTSWFQVTYAQKTENGCSIVVVPGYAWTKEEWDNQLRGMFVGFVPLSERFPYPMFAYTYVEDETLKWLWITDMLVFPEKQDPPLTLLAVVFNIDPKEVISTP